MKASTCCVLVCAILVAVAWLPAIAGPLNPPVGAVASTPGPEPRIAVSATNTPGDSGSVFRIDFPGSYYLTGNLVGVAGKNGINITTGNVTLDLMGFEVRGANGLASLDGIRVGGAGGVNIAVFNGSVSGWGGDGIDAVTGMANVRIDGIRASGNGADGIKVGVDSLVSNCSAFDNSGDGIETGDGCSVLSCTARANDVNGLRAGGGNTVTGCASMLNGIDGITIGIASTISCCSAQANVGAGIRSSTSSTISSCSAENNSTFGIVAADFSAIAGCTAAANGSNGIEAGNSVTVSGCSSYDNTGHGITAASGCEVTGCTSRFNSTHGIRVVSNCAVRENTSTSNGTVGPGSGIFALGSDNRIDGNHCTDNDVGVECDVGGNLIIRNTCAGNTTFDWSLVADNVFGPIIDRRSPGSGLVEGFSAASTLGSTDANANYSY